MCALGRAHMPASKCTRIEEGKGENRRMDLPISGEGSKVKVMRMHA